MEIILHHEAVKILLIKTNDTEKGVKHKMSKVAGTLNHKSVFSVLTHKL